MNSHLKRWITALIALPILIGVIGYGSELLFALFIAAVIAAAMVEYGAMTFGDDHRLEKGLSIGIALLVPAAAWSGGIPLMMATATLSLPAVFSIHLLRREDPREYMGNVVRIVFGVLYVAVMMSFFILLRAGDEGRTWIFFLIVMAFSTDVMAFYAGRTWGRRKLLPSVSAGKTVEGALGGLAGCVTACLVYALIFVPDLWPGHALAIGFLGSILGQLGDLSESAVKRASMVKDSGSIIPGHGGILDRLDSFIFMAPFLYWYKEFVIVL